MPELESKYSEKFEVVLIVIYAIVFFSSWYFFTGFAMDLDFVVGIIGEKSLYRIGFVTIGFAGFVLVFIRPLIKKVLYKKV